VVADFVFDEVVTVDPLMLETQVISGCTLIFRVKTLSERKFWVRGCAARIALS